MAVGYAIRNFKVGDVFIQQAKIDHEQILIHAIICKITMMYKNSMKLTSFKTYELLHSLPVVGQILATCANKLVYFVFETISELIEL